ncbi:MAG: hypothetical protein IIW14_02830, partial [Kiritimatiellae bacterium]|nr:hypothetical protein [Kiritimatiellia bacterium]
MRVLIMMAMCIAAAGMYASPVVYTVTAGVAGTTNLLADATVEIDDNGIVSSAAFGEVVFAPDSVFRKRGEGFMKSCSGMGEFTGEVRIEEGAFIVDDTGQLGPCKEGSDGDPLVVVSNGASLVFAPDADKVAKNAIRLNGGIRIAGSGCNGIGVLRNEGSARMKYLFSSVVTLDGDALIVNASVAGDEDDAAWGTKSAVDFNLNSFTLTFSGRRFWSYGINIKNPGNIVVAGDGYLQLQVVKSWNGTAENTLTVKSGGLVEFYYGAVETPWTLVMEDGSQLRGRTPDSIGNAETDYWSGPVVLEGRMKLENFGKSYGVALRGDVSGPGGIDLMCGGLELLSSGNSFTGGVRIYTTQDSDRAELGLWRKRALPSPLTSTNSSLYLRTEGIYELPALSFHALADKTVFAAGGSGGTVASLLKTGPGVLELTAPLAVTGGVTLAGGTLRLSSVMSAYSPAPGLIESRLTASKDSWGELFDGWYTDGTEMNTNRIVAAPELAQVPGTSASKPFGDYEFIRYAGYIWNRSSEDVVWTFATAINPQNLLYIDDRPVIKRSTTNNDSYWKMLAPTNVTLSPGKHKFDLRLATSGKSGSTYNKAGARSDLNNVSNWPEGFGLVIDFKGRGSYDGGDYSIPSNNVLGSVCGGDGSLFTVDARPRGDLTGADYSRASFPRLEAAPGTVLNLNFEGCTFTVQELSGVTAVTNGSLHVASKWTLDNNALAAGSPLKGSARISFAAGWTLSLPELGTLKNVPRRITLAVSPDGGLALPAVFDRGTDLTRKWQLELSGDGTRLDMVRYSS